MKYEPEVKAKMQKMFEKAVKGLLKQRKKSEGYIKGGIGENCLYRGPDNTRCGVGFLITNKNYKPYLEGSCASNEDVLKAVSESQGFSLEKGVFSTFLDRLQYIHDQSPVREWAKKFRELADNCGLDTTFMKGMR